jgi:hypothetical protein
MLSNYYGHYTGDPFPYAHMLRASYVEFGRFGNKSTTRHDIMDCKNDSAHALSISTFGARAQQNSIQSTTTRSEQAASHTTDVRKNLPHWSHVFVPVFFAPEEEDARGLDLDASAIMR